MNSASNVNKDFKILSMLGMIFILCGHYGSLCFTLGGLFIYDTFHIPLFIFISGYFFKSHDVDEKSNFLKYIKKKVFRLLIPYYLWNFIYLIFAYYFQRMTDFRILYDEITITKILISPLQLADGAVYNVASWFLMALFMCHMVNGIVRFVLHRWQSNIKEMLLLIMSLVVAYISIKLSQSNWDSPWKITVCRTGYLLFYYNLGIVYKMYLEKVDNKLNDLVALTVTVMLKVCIIVLYGNIIPICYNMVFDKNVETRYYFFSAILGIYFWMRISKILSLRLGNNKIVLYYSNHTFSLMMHQGIVGLVINGIIIHCLNLENIQDIYHNNIWFNPLIEPQCIFQPILISIIIILALKLYDWIKEKISFKIKKC